VSLLDGVLLFLAAAAGGAMNSVAGGGSLITFPALLFLGVPAVPANATSTVALWPGSVAGAVAYRNDLRSSGNNLLPWSMVSFVGGLLGALLLLRTSSETLRTLVPWLMLVATLTFAFGGKVVGWMRQKYGRMPSAPATGQTTVTALLVQLLISVYGGFFGGGIGFMMLATFSLSGMSDIHAMNGMKSWLAACINGVAVVTFVVAGAVFWPQTLAMVTGAIAGGFAGAAQARRLDPVRVRRFVIFLGLALTGYFFLFG